MTLTIELTPEEEARLQEEAQRAGMEPNAYAHRLLAEDLAVLPENPTGAQIVEYLKRSGALGVYADRPDGPEFARQLRGQVWQSDADDPELQIDPSGGDQNPAVVIHGEQETIINEASGKQVIVGQHKAENPTDKDRP
jgi:hypothetical protein